MTAKAMRVKVNGVWRDLLVRPHDRLVDVLRDQMGLMGTKEGCGEGECGACTVILDGKTALACLTPAAKAEGREVVTIEGIAQGDTLHPLQQAFIDEGAVQCGFCTPGLILTAKILLDHDPDPSEDTVRRALAGNICRCTGYEKPIKAVLTAAAVMRGEQ